MPNATSAGTVLFELPASVTPLEQPLETPKIKKKKREKRKGTTLTSKGRERYKGPVPAKLLAEKLAALPDRYISGMFSFWTIASDKPLRS